MSIERKALLIGVLGAAAAVAFVDPTILADVPVPYPDPPLGPIYM